MDSNELQLFRDGSPIGKRDEILLDASFARAHRIAIDARVRVAATTGTSEFTVAGTFTPDAAASFGGSLRAAST